MELANKHAGAYSIYSRILIILLFLTAITVMVAWFDFRELTIIIAMLIACIKGSLVLVYFMHLKHEKLVIKSMVAMVLILLVVMFVILFFDYWFR